MIEVILLTRYVNTLGKSEAAAESICSNTISRTCIFETFHIVRTCLSDIALHSKSHGRDMRVTHTCKSSARDSVENASSADSKNDPLPSHNSFSFDTRACRTVGVE